MTRRYSTPGEGGRSLTESEATKLGFPEYAGLEVPDYWDRESEGWQIAVLTVHKYREQARIEGTCSCVYYTIPQRPEPKRIPAQFCHVHGDGRAEFSAYVDSLIGRAKAVLDD